MIQSEFNMLVKDNIREYLPTRLQDADISLGIKRLPNNNTVDQLIIKTAESNVSPVINLDDFYNEQLNKDTMPQMLKGIADFYLEHEQKGNYYVSDFMRLDKVLSKIRARLVNFENSGEYLEVRPYTRIGDLAVVYVIDVGDFGEGEAGSVIISDGMLKEYNITVTELHEIAVRNMANEEIYFKSMRDTLIEELYPAGTDEMIEFMLPPEMEPPVYVLSNKDQVYGAAIAVCSSKMDEIADRLDGDFYIIPSSVHELLVVPYREHIDLHDFDNMVCAVNSEVAAQEILSDHLYGYDAERHELITGEQLKNRIAERSENVKDTEKIPKDSVLAKLSSKQHEADTQKHGSHERTSKIAEAVR